MMADRTSASSGEITSSRSSSVLDGAICSSGISSPVAGSRYWIRLWWDSSVSSSIRMPVCRSTSIIAQAPEPAVFFEGEVAALAGGGVFGPDPAGRLGLHHRPAQRLPAGGEQPSRRGRRGRPAAARRRRAFGLGPGDQGGQHRQPFPGPLVHPGLACGAVLLVGGVAGADRAAHRVRPPPGRVLVGPFGDVEVERPDCGEHAAPVQAGGHRLHALAVAGGCRRGPGHHALLPCRGDVPGQLEGADAGVVGFQVGPEQLAEQVGQALQRGEVRRRPGVRAGSRPARRGPAGRRCRNGRSAARMSAARGRRSARIAAGASWPNAPQERSSW